MGVFPEQKLILHRYSKDGYDEFYWDGDPQAPSGSPSETFTFTIRPYTFREQLVAETQATVFTVDSGPVLMQEKYVEAILRSVLSEAEVEQIMRLPSWVGEDIWLAIQMLSKPPNRRRWNRFSSPPTESGGESRSSTRATSRTRLSDG